MDLQTTNMHILILGWRTFNTGIIGLIFVNAYYKHLKIVHAELKASSVHANTYKVEDSLPKFENQQSSIKKSNIIFFCSWAFHHANGYWYFSSMTFCILKCVLSQLTRPFLN